MTLQPSVGKESNREAATGEAKLVKEGATKEGITPSLSAEAAPLSEIDLGMVEVALCAGKRVREAETVCLEVDNSLEDDKFDKNWVREGAKEFDKEDKVVNGVVEDKLVKG